MSEEGKGLNGLLDTEIRDHKTVGTERPEEALGKQGLSPDSPTEGIPKISILVYQF